VKQITMRSLAAVLALIGFVGCLALSRGTISAAGCSVQKSHYLGWKAEQMSNAWVKLEIVPQLGGRLMQVTFGGHNFLFVNKELEGKYFPPDTTHFHWYNYGGDKIWPMPEGSQNEQEWPGAGGEPLDDDPYALQVLSRGSTCTVQLTSPVDPLIGQQYTRDISIGSNSPVISFHAIMKNVTGHPERWSEQSVSQYNAAAPGEPSTFNPQFYGFTPANPNSVYLKGYHVRTGPGSNRSYSIADGLFRLHWSDFGGEVWVDSPGGWVAVVDGTTDYTMVERMNYDPSADYPGKATVIFFTTGRRNFRPVTPPPHPRPPIFYMEAEVNSPMVNLEPGQTYAMDTKWYPTRMGSDFKTVTFSGVVGQPLAANSTPAGLTLTGQFGVFYKGTLIAHYYNRGGEPIGTANLGNVTPLQPVNLQKTVQAPPETARVSLHVAEESGLDMGSLGEAFVNPPPPPPVGRGY
jgi:hypothetical protein